MTRKTNMVIVKFSRRHREYRVHVPGLRDKTLAVATGKTEQAARKAFKKWFEKLAREVG